MLALWAVLPTLLSISASALLSRAPGAAGPWWRALYGECWATWRVFTLRQPWRRQAPDVLAADSGAAAAIPVLLVHGYLCNHRLWDTAAPQLRAHGHTLLALDLEPVFTSIDDYAAAIAQGIARLRAATGAPQVALVGHSMGGLAIRAYVRAHGLAQVAGIVTLGTPHAGTRLARATRTPNGRQMQWHSDWLQTLAAQEGKDLRARLRIAITAQDNIVYPQRAQTLAGVTPTVFTGMGHLQLALHPAVLRWLLQALAGLPASGTKATPSTTQ